MFRLPREVTAREPAQPSRLSVRFALRAPTELVSFGLLESLRPMKWEEPGQLTRKKAGTGRGRIKRGLTSAAGCHTSVKRRRPFSFASRPFERFAFIEPSALFQDPPVLSGVRYRQEPSEPAAGCHTLPAGRAGPLALRHALSDALPFSILARFQRADEPNAAEA